MKLTKCEKVIKRVKEFYDDTIRHLLFKIAKGF